MAFTASNLHLRAGAPGDLSYTYDAGDDAMATVAAVGYFNNTDDGLNLVADDLIWCQCTDGNMFLRVASVSSGSVTTQFAGGNLPIQTFATGTSGVLNLLSVGMYEVGTSIATATRNVLPTPYPGAEVLVRKVDSGTQAFNFDAGACASDISVGLGGGTGVTYDAVGNRRIRLAREGEGFHVVGTSTSRWRIRALEFSATGASASAGAGASVVLAGS
ncbi:MAG: hypothetical protein Q8P46_00450 [Hyphomicrobiales bacterium]|nr:hypothetical protein [Hyphomicrobiales bacterium]